jgi:hypothetical protein
MKIMPEKLLGLNLKYCIAISQLQQDIDKTVMGMAYSIRTTYYLNTTGTNANCYLMAKILKDILTHAALQIPKSTNVVNLIATYEYR